jgi:hypothetical protein
MKQLMQQIKQNVTLDNHKGQAIKQTRVTKTET